ncbi:hypothetical protein HGP16_27845 [Rhizobium sp. P40RR-XXII]|uniref:hypothetical protein n=1 Tax=Rhizobium sp. P40RR-XXII TaxID=2726739 RepID=UPI0014566421|nr:hypothetical protein [Rhizobium sp. P40RR-XXII]NLS20348.1 hypothetical protein [Rhizobium sp. P40RR-XXII]
MINRRLLLAAAVGTSILAAVAARALPLDTLSFDTASRDIVKVDDREHERKSQTGEYRQPQDGNGDYAANDCGEHGEEEDDGGSGGVCGNENTPIPKDATRPSNGLFVPGSMPHSQMN